MLSVEECRKRLKNKDISEKAILEIRDGLYQIAGALVNEYISGKRDNKQRVRETL